VLVDQADDAETTRCREPFAESLSHPTGATNDCQ
jgi:hypothetical protein